MIGRRVTALTTLALALGPPSVQAREAPDPEHVESAVRFGLPALFAGYQATCADQLDPDGYVIQNADRLRAKFAEGADAHWPAAKSALFELGADHGVEEAMLSEMPDDALKPFVYALLEQIAATEVKSDHCTDVERGLELLDPLPADNLAGLVGFIMEVAGDEDAGSTNALGGN